MDDATLDQEVRSHVLDVLADELTPEGFQDWLVEAGWNDRTPLVAQIDLLFAERSLLTDREFRLELGRIAGTVWLSEPHMWTFGLSNQLVSAEPMSFGGDVTIRQHLAFVGS